MFYRLPQNFFGHALRINVGRVEHSDAGFKADIDQSCGLGNVAITPGFEKLATAAKRA